jgi:hypothetical protein
MLMITEERNSDVLTFKLAGTLAGDWALEFKRCWQIAAHSQEASRIIVELTEVTFVDEEGKDLLSRMIKEGAEVIASDIMVKSIVDEIASECQSRELSKGNCNV